MSTEPLSNLFLGDTATTKGSSCLEVLLPSPSEGALAWQLQPCLEKPGIGPFPLHKPVDTNVIQTHGLEAGRGAS